MSRIALALLLYSLLAAVAAWSLRGDVRLVTLILLAGLAAKTWIGEKKAQSTAADSDTGTKSLESSQQTGQPQQE